MNYYIVTGASRGIGEAITRKLIEPGNTIFAVSRTMNEDLVELASSLNVPLYYVEADLCLREESESFINGVFDKIQLTEQDRIALINNAGMLEPVGPLKSTDFVRAEKHLHLNLLAPLILSSVFAARTESISLPKVILNISSGAAFYPYHGWSVYCSSKAGLDMLTKVAGLEQTDELYPVTIFALAPGIIETGMQESIRETDVALFPDRDKFISLHEEGKLAKPEDVAQTILSTIFNNSLVTGSVVTIDQLKEIKSHKGSTLV
jgi:benzil reductase ((S)-benzoin forming)